MTTKKLTVLALLVALCGVGGLVKIPSPTGTVALDSLPGFLGAVLLGGWSGALVGFLGHLFSAATVAFPFGLPVHLYVAAQMAIYVSIFGYLYRKAFKVPAVIAGVALNGVIAPLLLVPIYGSGFFLSMLPSLTVGSAVNIILAAVLAQSKVLQRVGGNAKN